tara:strand:+ start:318 stop:596 length:279 start_codon:yes stop_codon:yes gene_type:complete
MTSDDPQTDNVNNEDGQKRSKRTVNPQLLSLLVCPLTRSPLIYNPDLDELISLQAGYAFKITYAVPIMLPETARLLNETELAKWQTSSPRDG